MNINTLSGILTARRVGAEIELDFPATPPAPADAPPGLAKALGVKPVYVGRSKFDYLVVVSDESEVRNLKPDHARLRQLQVRGVMVTAPGSGSYDFGSRFFAPGAGIDEDPVTGSAHCCLGPYWGEKLGKTELNAYQVSPRGGEIWVHLAGERVLLRGKAVTVIAGELLAGG